MGGRRVVEVRPAADWDKGRAVVGGERVPETDAGAMLPSIRDVIFFLEALAL